MRLSAADAAGKPCLARAMQLVHHAASAGHGHQQCLCRAAYPRARACGEAKIGGDQPHPADTPQPADVRGDQRDTQRGQQPFWRDGTRPSEGAPDVLVMNEGLDPGDPAPSAAGSPRACR